MIDWEIRDKWDKLFPGTQRVRKLWLRLLTELMYLHVGTRAPWRRPRPPQPGENAPGRERYEAWKAMMKDKGK